MKQIGIYGLSGTLMHLYVKIGYVVYSCIVLLISSSLLFSLWSSNLQNHYVEGEEKVKADFSKLHEDMQEAFRKLEE